MLKDEYKIYEEKMKKSIESVANDFAAPPSSRSRPWPLPIPAPW